MKKTSVKRLLAIVMVALLAFTAAIPAMAVDATTGTIKFVMQENYSNKVTLTDGRYEAYQIFSGTLSENSELNPNHTQLTDIDWGDGVNSAVLLAALAADETFGAAGITIDSTAADVADVLDRQEDNSVLARAFAEIVANTKGCLTEKVYTNTGNEITGLPSGYYLVRDTKTKDTIGDDDAISALILRVVGGEEVEIYIKADVPTLEKEIVNIDHNNKNGEDYEIGEDVEFKLTGTLPDEDVFKLYTTYKYVFHDALSTGLELLANTIEVYVNNEGDEPIKLEAGKDYTLKTSGTHDASCSFEIIFDDIKSVDGVDADSVITVEYSAKLTADANFYPTGANNNEAYIEYSNNPNKGGEGETGTTTEEKVYVYSFQLNFEKKDQQGAVVKAEFVLKNSEGKYAEFTVDEDTNTYTFKAWKDAKKDATTIEVDENGNFKVEGLEDGTYYLEETFTPKGYDDLSGDIKIVIVATYKTANEPGELESYTVTVSVVDEEGNAVEGAQDEATYDNEDNANIVRILNYSQPILPGTGGMGTTIFYVLGGAILAAAAIFLAISKRKAHQ